MDIEKLIIQAISAREFSYSPYSSFKVGAALLAKNGNIYTGCNIENAAYSPANCAERTAFFKAVSDGVADFEAIAIAGGLSGKPIDAYCTPCGVCRQVMMEFCKPDFMIICAKSTSDYKIYTLDSLLPFGFGPASIM